MIGIWLIVNAVAFCYLVRSWAYFPFICMFVVGASSIILLIAFYDSWPQWTKRDRRTKLIVTLIPCFQLILMTSVVFNWYGFEDVEIQLAGLTTSVFGVIYSALQQIFVICLHSAINMVRFPRCCSVIYSKCEIVMMKKSDAVSMRDFESEMHGRRITLSRPQHAAAAASSRSLDPRTSAR